MAEAITNFARLLAKAGKEEAVKAECLKMIDPTRAEAGCISYDFHQSDENPSVFFFHESWTGRDALNQHMATPHMKSLGKALADLLVENFSLVITKMISKPAPAKK